MTSKPFEGHFHDPILEAARAHGKEPEPVDWEAKCGREEFMHGYWHERFLLREDELVNLYAENARLKNVILRLEQRCAKLENIDGQEEKETA